MFRTSVYITFCYVSLIIFFIPKLGNDEKDFAVYDSLMDGSRTYLYRCRQHDLTLCIFGILLFVFLLGTQFLCLVHLDEDAYVCTLSP